MQIKTTMRYHLTSVIMPIIQKTRNNKCRQGWGPLCTVSGKISWCSHYGKCMEIAQKIKRSYEKWDLQKKRHRTPERIDRLVIILPVVCLKHHVALVTLKCLLDVTDKRLHCFLSVTLFLLYGIGASVKRKEQKVYHQT